MEKTVPKTIEELRAENEAFSKNLTNKNESYIHSLKKALDAGGVSEVDQTKALADVLPKLVDGQKKGTTARQLFGTATEYATALISGPNKKADAGDTKDWMRVIDTALVFMVFLSLMYGVMGLISKNAAAPMGILSLVVNSLLVGWGVVMMNKIVGVKGQPRTQPLWKIILMFAGFVLAFFVIFTLTMNLPVGLNPVLNQIGYLITGAVSLGARMLFKRYFKVTGSIFG